METGLLMERVIAAKYEKHHPNDRFEKVHFLLQHPTCHWALANLDGIIRIDGGGIKVIEMKNVQERTFESWEGKIPPYYLAQVQHQLWVTGLQEAILAVMVGGVHQHHFDIKRDETIIARQAEAGAAFWSMVEAGTPPEASDADSAYLGKTYSYHKEDVPAAEIPLDQVMAFKAAGVKLELAEAEYEAQKNRIKQLLGWSSVGTVDGKKAFSYSTSKGRETIDTKALAAAFPGIAREFTRTHEGSRVLRFVYKDK
jgi:predicted phage-related endonuclease